MLLRVYARVCMRCLRMHRRRLLVLRNVRVNLTVNYHMEKLAMLSGSMTSK